VIAPHLALPEKDIELLRRMPMPRKFPSCFVLYSGRPRIFGEALGLCDALVAAWLPARRRRHGRRAVRRENAHRQAAQYHGPRPMAQIRSTW